MNQEGYTLAPSINLIALADRCADSFLSAVFIVYVAVLLILPTGSILGINIKILLFAVVSMLMIRLQGLRGFRRSQSFFFVLALIGLLMIWAVMGMARGYQAKMVLFQFRDIAVTIFGSWLIVAYAAGERIHGLRFLQTVLYSVGFTSLLKCAMLAYSLKTGTPVSDLNTTINNSFHIQLMTIDFDSLETTLGRIQFVSDSVLPICIFVLQARRREIGIPGWIALIMMPLYILSIGISFSRYGWAYALLALAVGGIVSKRDRLHPIYIAMGSVVVAMNFGTFLLLWQLRFSKEVAGLSDIDRLLQRVALIDFFHEAPFFGHGLGSYTTAVIRSNDLPYSYENQWLALMGQIGIVGVILLLVSLAVCFRSLYWPPIGRSRYQVALLLIMIAWLVGGVFNPFLISSTASVAYGILFVLIAV
jgi:O-antigen ligase